MTNRRFVLCCAVLATLACVCLGIPPPTYEYVPSEWSQCTRSCGSGWKFRTISCVQKYNSTQRVVFNSFCQHIPQPRKIRRCNFEQGCPPQWYLAPTGPCSRTCGGGFRQPVRVCRQLTAEGVQIDLPFERCENVSFRAQPAATVPCNLDVPCHPRYQVGNWSACSATCGQGLQWRHVRCWRSWFGIDRHVPNEICRQAYGIESTRLCDAGICRTNYDWTTTPWSLCSVSCRKSRRVFCVSKKDGTYVSRDYCSYLGQPPAESAYCINTGQLVWRATSWSACSARNGVCGQQRSVTCFNSRNGRQALSCPQCTKPIAQRTCLPRECGITDRRAGQEGGESSACRLGYQSRQLRNFFCSRHHLKRKCRRLCDPDTEIES